MDIASCPCMGVTTPAMHVYLLYNSLQDSRFDGARLCRGRGG
jgi:hypothetical protein